MINLTREEAQQVLDDLEGEIPFYLENDCDTPEWITNAIELLRAKLSEPDDVPKWIYQEAVPEGTEVRHWAVVMHDMDKTVEGWSEDVKMYYDGKLIAPQPEPKPLGWIVMHEGMNIDELRIHEVEQLGYDEKPMPNQYRVYTAPPQREWVGLTSEEMAAAWSESKGDVLYRLKPFASAIEFKLKEKNAPYL